jgi:hypothetical protein
MFLSMATSFFSDHKCKIKAIHLLEGRELSDTDNNSDEEILPAYSSEEEPTAISTICASNNITNHNSLQFKGQVGSIYITSYIPARCSRLFYLKN